MDDPNVAVFPASLESMRDLCELMMTTEEIELLDTLMPSHLVPPVDASPENPGTSQYLLQEGCDEFFIYLMPVQQQVFNDDHFGAHVNDLKRAFHDYKPNSENPLTLELQCLTHNKHAIAELNKFFFRLDNHPPFVCALLDVPEKKEDKWQLFFFRSLPEIRFAKYNMHTMEHIVDPDGKMGWRISKHELPLMKIWKEIMKEETAHINRIVFDPQRSPGFHRSTTTVQAPNRNLVSYECFNLWRGLPFYGFLYPPHLNDRFDAALERFLFHVFFVICDRDIAAANYLLDWIAYRRIFPWRCMEVAICITGPQGTGKTIFMRILQALFGKFSCVYPQNPNSLDQRFNSMLENRIIVMLDEVQLNDGSCDLLKTMITGQDLDVEAKHENKRLTTNRLGLIVSSNHETDALPRELHQRRVCWLSVNPRIKSQNYFKSLANLIDDRGFLQALDFYFQRRATRPEFANFNPRCRPLTLGLRRAIQAKLCGVRHWLNVISQQRDIYVGVSHGRGLDASANWPAQVCLGSLHNYYQQWKKETYKLGKRDTELKEFAGELSKVFGLPIPVDNYKIIDLPNPDFVQKNLYDENEYIIQ